MSKRLLVIVLSLVAFAATAQAAPWTDDFTRPRRYERWGPDVWTLGAGQAAFKAAGGNAFMVATGPLSRQITVTADLTVTSRTGSSWATAGLTLLADAMNHWRLLLVEGPRQERYFELIEMLDGEHQAQTGANTPRTRLEGATKADLETWEIGRPYHLKLELTPEQIVGTVTDAGGKGSWQRSYSFARGAAVTAGRAGLMAAEMNGAFGPLTVDAVMPSPNPALALKAGPQGTVAIIPDQAQTVAPRLAALLGQAGYGVTVIPWEQLDAPLPWDKLDVLVLADARRAPVAARDRLAEASHCGGKVVCLGAPALSELLVRGPEGQWLPQGQWLGSYARTLQRRAITVAPGAWQRQTSNGDLPGEIVADPGAGPTAWRVTSDLKGWDTYCANVSQPFEGRYRLLMFEAKGDAKTSQLSIEMDEADGSRWIAVVELKPDWQTVVLQAADFSYWQDSKSKGRGGAGDRLHPENVDAIIFGLASSHTRSVRAGLHTYSVREIAAAGGEAVPEPDFGVPNLEALSPSYKLYPMDEVAQLRPAAAQTVTAAKPVAWAKAAYAPVWREQGRGLHRGRPWRWLPILDAYDAAGRKRGALVSL
ncbi:MAG: hypothetical protein KKI08_18910, partial [Armatimonadetes bacterium]|nr:hypothetical protein [Armatimonadota bacterium]